MKSSNIAIEEGISELEWKSRMGGSIGHCKGNRKVQGDILDLD
jgi:hypothetical protein